MSNGYHFVYLPILFSLIIPSVLLHLSLTMENTFFFDLIFVVTGILIFVYIVDFWRVFLLRKGNVKKFHNALRGKDVIKFFVFVSIIALTFSITLQIGLIQYNNYAEEKKEDKIEYDSIVVDNMIFFSLYFLLFSITPLLPIIMTNDYYRGRSYIYFQLGLNEEKQARKIWHYQNGLESYDKFLQDMFGIKLKHIDKIESYLLAENPQEIENKIEKLSETFEDKLEPARKLNSWIDITKENFFKNQQPYQHAEKILKYITPIIPAATAVTIYFISTSS